MWTDDANEGLRLFEDSDINVGLGIFVIAVGNLLPCELGDEGICGRLGLLRPGEVNVWLRRFEIGVVSV